MYGYPPHQLFDLRSNNYLNQKTSSQRSLKYRPDIDGLRAIAVISVVLFHAFPGSIFKSGFTGVDIFFVISGFLISTIIFKGMDERTNPTGAHKPFSFWDFYSRRVRRIFPSLIFCLVTFLALGWLYMLPDEYSLLGKHTMGAAGYVSNLVLWSEAGDYFQTASQTKPLLHLWSLGIEEQFYLVWPALLFIAWKLRLNILTFALLGAAASFGFELHVVRANPSAAFYSPLLRFWELMAGSILAWLKLYKTGFFKAAALKIGPAISQILFAGDGKSRNPIKVCTDALSFLGLALIFISIFGLNARHFPGSKALYPVLGAVFIIAAGKKAFFNRILLSNKLMVWLGLVSYPLYIWHWPFLSFCWIFSGSLPDLKIRIVCIAVSIFMAAVTYYLIEPHLRWGKNGNAKATSLLLAMLATGFCGYEVWHHGGYPNRTKDPIQEEVQKIENTFKDANSRCDKVIPDWRELTNNDISGITYCKLTKNEGYNNIALIGDSHAGMLFAGLVKYKLNIAAFPAGCAVPLMKIHARSSRELSKREPFAQHTEYLMEEGFSYILAHSNITKVILAHRPFCSYTDELKDLMSPNEKKRNVILQHGFERTFEALTKAGKQIYVVLDNPNYEVDSFEACRAQVSRSLRPHKVPDLFDAQINAKCTLLKEKRADKKFIEAYSDIAKQVAAKYPNVKFIDLSNVLCRNGICSMIDNKGRLLYRDSDHLNSAGSLFVAPTILKVIRN